MLPSGHYSCEKVTVFDPDNGCLNSYAAYTDSSWTAPVQGDSCALGDDDDDGGDDDDEGGEDGARGEEEEAEREEAEREEAADDGQ